MDEYLQQYRTLLITGEQEAQEAYDKAVLSLSGGALGISFAFVRDIVGTQPLVQTDLLLTSWVAWGISATLVLVSFYVSKLAFKKALQQVDADQIYTQHPGGVFDRLTTVLNVLSGLLFLAGVLSIVSFVYYNLR